jgi:alkyl hydroperoxide reductase subunit AhpC
MSGDKAAESRATKWRGYATNLLIVIVVVTLVRAWQQRDIVTGFAQPLQGVMLAGQPYALPEHPQQAVLVHFWATWCPVCRAEQGNIAAIAAGNPNVITVAMQSGKSEEVIRHMNEQGIYFPVLNDADGRIARAWGVHAVPASFIIAPDGKIQFVEVGYTTEVGLRLRLWWAGR